MSKTLVNPSSQPVRVVLVDGTELTIAPMSMARVEADVAHTVPVKREGHEGL